MLFRGEPSCIAHAYTGLGSTSCLVVGRGEKLKQMAFCDLTAGSRLNFFSSWSDCLDLLAAINALSPPEHLSGVAFFPGCRLGYGKALLMGNPDAPSP